MSRSDRRHAGDDGAVGFLGGAKPAADGTVAAPVRGGGFRGGRFVTGRNWWWGGPWTWPWVEPVVYQPWNLYSVPVHTEIDEREADRLLGHAVMRFATDGMPPPDDFPAIQPYLDQLAEALRRAGFFGHAEVAKNLRANAEKLSGSVVRFLR